MPDLDYERIETEPETYFNELAEGYRKDCKEIKEQINSINTIKTLLGANIQGPSILPIIQPSINNILKNQTGSLEQVLEKLGENAKSAKQKQENIQNWGDQLGQIYANAGFQGKTSSSLNSTMEEIRALNSAYEAYISTSQNAKPIIESRLKS